MIERISDKLDCDSSIHNFLPPLQLPLNEKSSELTSIEKQLIKKEGWSIFPLSLVREANGSARSLELPHWR